MKAISLLLLRLSLGLLMLVWGVDKLVNVEHGMKVSKQFYLGAFGSVLLLNAFGVVQMGIGGAILAGAGRRIVYPALLAITGVTLLGVWRSVIDPWGWYMQGGNALFFPSLIIFAGAFVLLAFRDEDLYVVGRRAAAR